MDTERPTPPIREVWNALTHPLFLIEPAAARAYDDFMCRLRSVLDNGEEGIAWGIAVLETASRLMDNTMYEEATLNRRLRHLHYIRRNAVTIAAFAAAQHAQLGPGIVAIDWPSSGFPSPKEIHEGVEYVTKEAWRLGEFPGPDEESPTHEDLEAGEQILQALNEYDPSRQAVVIFSDHENHIADALAATFIYEFPEGESPGSSSVRIRPNSN
jgi:hypothetical protein